MEPREGGFGRFQIVSSFLLPTSHLREGVGDKEVEGQPITGQQALSSSVLLLGGVSSGRHVNSSFPYARDCDKPFSIWKAG
jgi:hypothetical protein